MTIADMFGQSVIVTLLGMGVVFSFLIILIIAITLAGKIIHAFGLDKDLQAKVSPTAPVIAAAPSVGTANTAAVTAAIAAAVTDYRKTHA
jgi:oxaloacetate decarboxylase gamma subunit